MPKRLDLSQPPFGALSTDCGSGDRIRALPPRFGHCHARHGGPAMVDSRLDLEGGLEMGPELSPVRFGPTDGPEIYPEVGSDDINPPVVGPDETCSPSGPTDHSDKIDQTKRRLDPADKFDTRDMEKTMPMDAKMERLSNHNMWIKNDGYCCHISSY